MLAFSFSNAFTFTAAKVHHYHTFKNACRQGSGHIFSTSQPPFLQFDDDASGAFYFGLKCNSQYHVSEKDLSRFY